MPLAPTIAISGSSGFVGSRLFRSCLNDFRVVKLPQNVSELYDINAVIHLGGIAHRSATRLEYEKMNEATARLLVLAKKAGVQHFIFMSSIAAQSAPVSLTVLAETDVPNPTSNYGKAKLAAEKLVENSGIPFTILRPVAIVGDGAKGNPATIAKIAALPVLLPLGRIDAKRSIVAIEDVIAAIHSVLLNPSAYGQIYIVAGQVRSVKEMVASCSPCRARIIDISPKLLETIFSMVGLRSMWDRISGPLIADASKLESLGWTACFDNSSAIRSTTKHFPEQKHGLSEVIACQRDLLP
jgi:UDP-glucose 4-epimerase